MFEELFKTLIDLGFEPIEVRVPKQTTKHSDHDIDKVYINTEEAIAYRRIRKIANENLNNVRWDKAIEILTQDVNLISYLIKENKLKHPEELKEFVENCCAIFSAWDNIYRPAFNSIKEYRDSVKTQKSIDDMDADELREYIRTHKI